MSANRIRLLLIVNSLGMGGAEKHAISLLNSLDTQRFRMSFIYLKDDATLLGQLRTECAEGGLACAGVQRRLDLKAVHKIARHIEQERIDLILCTNTYSLLYASLARLAAQIKPQLVEVFHSTELAGWRDELQMLFYRPWIRASSALVYVSENQRHYWSRRGLRARSEHVIHNGIDAAHFSDCYNEEDRQNYRRRYGFRADELVVGLCAAMRPEKAHGDLITAVARLRAQRANVCALLIGDGPQRRFIEESIQRHGLKEHVRITGYVDDVRPLVASCDVMAITSHHVETFSVAALEAMALGKPMVMTQIGGASEQIRPGWNGYLYPRGDVVALCNALRQLEGASLRKAMGERARATVLERFTLGRMVRSYAGLLEMLAEQSQTVAEAHDAA